MSHKNYYPEIILILSMFFYSYSNSVVTGLGDCFKELHRRLSSQANEQMATISIDSVDEKFNLLLKNNSPVVKLFRVNSNGVVINESTPDNKNHVMRNISNQKWFENIKETGHPYYGITRDSSTTIFLFWVWPLKNNLGQFAGALCSKINPQLMVEYIQELDTLPLKIIINDYTVYSRKWKNKPVHQSVNWNISENLLISVYYYTKAHESLFYLKNEENTQNTVQPFQQTQNVAATDTSITNKKKKSGNNFLIFTFFSSLLITTFYLVLKKFKVNRKDVVRSISNINSDEIMDMIDDKPINNDFSSNTTTAQEPDKLSNKISSENVTSFKNQKKDIVSVQSFYQRIKDKVFSKAQPRFKPFVLLNKTEITDVSLYNKVYRELHWQLLHWVVLESSRIGYGLDELKKRLDEIEGPDNKELESIKKGASRLRKEIEIFKKNFHTSKNDFKN